MIHGTVLASEHVSGRKNRTAVGVDYELAKRNIPPIAVLHESRAPRTAW